MLTIDQARENKHRHTSFKANQTIYNSLDLSHRKLLIIVDITPNIYSVLICKKAEKLSF